MRVDEVIEELRASRANVRCKRLTQLLEGLGFEVRDGRRGGHKVFVHDGLPAFFSGGFNCGHGRDPEIKPAYIRKVIQILEEHRQGLEQLQER